MSFLNNFSILRNMENNIIYIFSFHFVFILGVIFGGLFFTSIVYLVINKNMMSEMLKLSNFYIENNDDFEIDLLDLNTNSEDDSTTNNNRPESRKRESSS